MKAIIKLCKNTYKVFINDELKADYSTLQEAQAHVAGVALIDQACLDARLFTKMQASGEIEMKLIYTAIFLFTLGACGATIDKHDENLKEVQREQYIYKGFANMQNALELKLREIKTKKENEAQYNAMIERINSGDDGVIYD